MYRSHSLVALSILLLLAGCGGTVQDPANTDATSPRMENQAVVSEKAESSAPAAKNAASVPAPAPADYEWVFVLKTMGLEPEAKEKILDATREKFLSGKKYHEVQVDAFLKGIAQYEGKKVLQLDASYSYGNFVYYISSTEVVRDGADLVQAPIEGEGIPNCDIPRSENIDYLLREIGRQK